MLDKLPEPARTVCAVAAFTGPSRSKLRGLKLSDIAARALTRSEKSAAPRREPKTEARESGVLVIPVLRKILAKYKSSFRQSETDGFFGKKNFAVRSIWTISRGRIFRFSSTERDLAGTHSVAGSVQGSTKMEPSLHSAKS